MTDAQRAALSPDSAEFHTRYLNYALPDHPVTLPPNIAFLLRVTGSKIQLAGWSTYSVLLWSLKASLLIFYRRLTAGVGENYRIRINIGFGFLAVSFVVVVMNLYLACRPFHKYWQINPDPGSASSRSILLEPLRPQPLADARPTSDVCQPAVSNQVVWVYLTFNVVTDLYLISIPLPMLWQASIKPLKKAALMLVFSGGILVVACAILRCAMIFTVRCQPGNFRLSLCAFICFFSRDYPS
jgi:hypothetical protein